MRAKFLRQWANAEKKSAVVHTAVLDSCNLHNVKVSTIHDSYILEGKPEDVAAVLKEVGEEVSDASR